MNPKNLAIPGAGLLSVSDVAAGLVRDGASIDPTRISGQRLLGRSLPNPARPRCAVGSFKD